MLANELDWIYELLNNRVSDRVIVEIEIDNLGQKFNNVRANWNMIGFSGVTNRGLKRYFQFHLEGILDILDTFYCLGALDNINDHDIVLKYIHSNLEGLLMNLKKNFSSYLDLNVNVPACVKMTFLNPIRYNVDSLRVKLHTAKIDTDLKNCLSAWLEQVNKELLAKLYTFAVLDYMNNVLVDIKDILDLESKDVTDILIGHLTFANFNYLGFFHYRLQKIQSTYINLNDTNKLKVLKNELFLLKFSEESIAVYDNHWPSLKTMLVSWVGDEIYSVKQRVKESEKKDKLLDRQKLFYNISVAHLALLTKLFQKENFFGDMSLTEIFKFMSRHYRTKRQHNISPGSISKSFYSTDQVTAAVIRDKLQKMINRIDHDFFPVLVVTLLVVHA